MKTCRDCKMSKPLDCFYVVTKRGVRQHDRYCKACQKIRNREAYARAREKRIASMRDYRAGLRQQVLDGYGGECECCGEDKRAFLTVDHVNGDGALHRKTLGTSGGPQFYRHIIESGFPKDRYRLLCYNCNCGRERNNGICPHEQAA